MPARRRNYPEKPVTFISDAAAGASPDVALRIVADGLGKLWGQNAVVVNHPGANGSIGARAASEAIADGYTLYAPALSTFIALPGVAPNLPVKLPRDFLPVGFIADQPMFFAVSPASGITSMSELIDRAKKNPGSLSIAVSGVGRVTHLTGVLMQQQAGITLTPVPYTGGPGAALSDVASGRVTMIIEGFSGIIGAVNAGQVKLIAVASPKRLAGISRSADGRRNASRLCRGWMAARRRPGRHAGPDHPQSQCGFDQGSDRSGGGEETFHHRQLCARDDARSDAGLCRPAAGNLGAGAAKDLDAVVSLAHVSWRPRSPAAVRGR